MTAIATITRIRRGLPEARMSQQVEVSQLGRAHAELPPEMVQFYKEADKDAEASCMVEIERPQTRLTPGTRITRTYYQGRWSGSHWSTVGEEAAMRKPFSVRWDTGCQANFTTMEKARAEVQRGLNFPAGHTIRGGPATIRDVSSGYPKQVERIPGKNKTETLAERIGDPNRLPLTPEFVAAMRRIAALNGKTEDEVWNLWRDYSDACDGCEQSTIISEFCEWNHMKEAAR